MQATTAGIVTTCFLLLATATGCARSHVEPLQVLAAQAGQGGGHASFVDGGRTPAVIVAADSGTNVGSPAPVHFHRPPAAPTPDASSEPAPDAGPPVPDAGTPYCGAGLQVCPCDGGYYCGGGSAECLSPSSACPIPWPLECAPGPHLCYCDNGAFCAGPAVTCIAPGGPCPDQPDVLRCWGRQHVCACRQGAYCLADNAECSDPNADCPNLAGGAGSSVTSP